jgi:branched-chain amino acid transport system ATP-binding protein
MKLLEIHAIQSGYGPSRVLHGVDLEIEQGEVIALLGRNGMGKTTTVNTTMGLIPTRAGEVLFEGKRLTGLPAHRIARAGLGLVPEGRQIFPNLTVEENLVATSRVPTATDGGDKATGWWSLERVYELFPQLIERRNSMGSTLSGGEQQMLAIGRALMTNPKLLILDEATEGLAPLIRQEIWSCLARLGQEGQSILVIDKNLADLTRIADRHYILEKGSIVWEGSSAALTGDPAIAERYLGV